MNIKYFLCIEKLSEYMDTSYRSLCLFIIPLHFVSKTSGSTLIDLQHVQYILKIESFDTVGPFKTYKSKRNC